MDDDELPSWSRREEEEEEEGGGRDSVGVTDYFSRRWKGAMHKATKVMRECRATCSGAETQALLKATRPNNDVAKERWVLRLLHMISEFPSPGPQATPAEMKKTQVPYRRFLESLWARMVEEDYRTVSKSIYILHRVAREASPGHTGGFRALLPLMQKEVCRSSSSSYFSLDDMIRVAPSGSHLKPFLESYGLFVYKRLLSFDKDFSEMTWLQPEKHPHKMNLMMENVKALSSHALQVHSTITPLLTEVTAPCLELVLRDTMEIWLNLLQLLQRSVQARYHEDGKFASRLDTTIRHCRMVLADAPKMMSFFEVRGLKRRRSGGSSSSCSSSSSRATTNLTGGLTLSSR